MNNNRNSPCWCGAGCKIKQCLRPNLSMPGFHSAIEPLLRSHGVVIKDQAQIEGVRRAGLVAATILDKTCQKAKEGVSLSELDDYAHALHLEAKAKPAPLGYGDPPFPKSTCISVNNVVCHGIPDGYRLREGDILNIDVCSEFEGFFGDCSRMVAIGSPSAERLLVLEVCYECLMSAIDTVRPGSYVSEIGDAIEKHAKQKGCSVVDIFVGHGVGLHMHEGPEIPHHRTKMHLPLIPGMIFTIEPMINAGSKEVVIDSRDGWTARTRDGKASAQWEHTLLVTETGVEILTPWSRDKWLD